MWFSVQYSVRRITRQRFQVYFSTQVMVEVYLSTSYSKYGYTLVLFQVYFSISIQIGQILEVYLSIDPQNQVYFSTEGQGILQESIRQYGRPLVPPIIRFDRFALVEKKHDKDVVELKIRFADFRYHKIRTFFNRKRHAKGNAKISRFLHDA